MYWYCVVCACFVNEFITAVPAELLVYLVIYSLLRLI